MQEARPRKTTKAKSKLVKRQYIVEGRNGYYGIDEYQEREGKLRCNRTIICVKTRKLAEKIVQEIDWAIHNFIEDNLK